MLRLETINSALLKAATKLVSIPAFDSFRIVGGTSAALQLGHRRSIDIDLFSNDKADAQHVMNVLRRHFPSAQLDNEYDWVTALINGIKVDIHPDWHTPFSDPPIVQNDLRLASLRDVAIFKINAIIGCREKKDYIDLFYLFEVIDPEQLLHDFKKAEPLLSDNSILFALGETNAAFANDSPMPEMLCSLDTDEVIIRMNDIRTNYFKMLEKQRNLKNPQKE